MDIFSPNLIGPVFGLSEFVLLLSKRSGSGARSADRGSLAILWGVIPASVVLAVLAGNFIPQASSPGLLRLQTFGGLLFVLGLVLRWYAIVYLGRYFTVNVAIAADHRLIDSGPYRYVRHPAYSGSLLEFLGLGITFANWLSLAVLLLPVLLAFAHRIGIEERALSQALGDAYVRYMTRTKRLIPGIY